MKYTDKPPQEEETVTIPGSEYRALIEIQSKYLKLIESKKRGGKKAGSKYKGNSEYMKNLVKTRWSSR